MAKHNGFSEDELCSAFADAVRNSGEFRGWVLDRTKFGGYAHSARLLHEEQISLRPRKHWWRHWWSYVPEINRERETDIFMVFETPSSGRFALHFEVKLGLSRFQPGQAAGYSPAARHMANKPEFLSYSDHQTVLICPREFRERYPDDASLFDVSLTFDELSPRLSHFAEKHE